MPRSLSFAPALAMALALGACAGAKPRPLAATLPPAPPRPLYDRLGGQRAIEAVVGELMGNVAADDRINVMFGMSDLGQLRTRLVDFICVATGGPCQYTGRDMKAAHAGMGVSGGRVRRASSRIWSRRSTS